MQTQLTDTRCFGYIRGSTEEQQNTLASQQQTIERYCDLTGLDLIACHTDSGESGSTPFFKRPAAARMIEEMHRDGITLIVFAKLDRFSRNVRDCLEVVDTFQRQGIETAIIDLKVNTREPMGRFFLTVMAALAELENGIRSARQKSALEVMRQQNQRTGNVPYGWDTVKALGRTSKTTRAADDLIPNAAE